MPTTGVSTQNMSDLWHVAHHAARHLVTPGPWSVPQDHHMTTVHMETANHTAEQGGLTTTTGAQQTVSVNTSQHYVSYSVTCGQDENYRQFNLTK